MTRHKYKGWTRIVLIVITVLGIYFWGNQVKAEGESDISINLRIESKDQTIINSKIFIPYFCEVTDDTGATSTYTGYKAICALQKAQENGLLNFSAGDFGFGLFVNKINNIGLDENMFWALYQNNSASMLGATDLPLNNDDEMLMAYVDWNYSNEVLKTLIPTTSTVGEKILITAQEWSGKELKNLNSPTTFFINGNSLESTSGTLEHTLDSAGTLEIYIEALGKIRSEKTQLFIEDAPIVQSRLKLETSSSTPLVGTTTTISATELSFDSTWIASVSSTIVINENEFFTTSGTHELYITTTTPFKIYAKKEGFLSSDVITLTPTTTIENKNENTNNNNFGGSGSSTNNSSENQNIFNIQKAINFLTSKQKENGQISSNEIFNDWSAIALGAYNPTSATAENMKKYLLSDPNPLTGMNQVSDYARRAMALMALNINPYSGTKTNYITKIIEKFDGTELFDGNSSNKGTCNDDIFGLLVLLNSGYTDNDDLIQKLTDFIISKQNNGAWSGVDLTAAAIQTLSKINSEKANTAINQAKAYLKNKQKDDGGFGDEYSTSWVIQAINSLNENQNSWIKNNKTPIDYLISKQDQDNGNINTSPDDENNKIWATSYAIPAGLDKNWNEILFDFEKTQNNNSLQNSNTETPTTTPTSTILTTSTIDIVSSTIEIVTTTLEITTTTLEIIIPTSTPTSTIQDTDSTTPTSAPTELRRAKQNKKITDTPKTEETKNTETKIENTDTISHTPTSTIPISPAKIAFATSVSAAGGLGAYLAWRLLQSLL